MTTLPLRISQADYMRAAEFVIGHLRRVGHTATSLRPLLAMVTLLYMTALFVITTAPNYVDGKDRVIVRACVLALFAVLPLLALGAWRLRKADARALQSLDPPLEEELTLSVSADHVRLHTPKMTAEFRWSTVAIYVLEPDFAVLLVPRMAPLPLTPAACSAKGQFLDFLRLAQQYKGHDAAL